MSISRGNAQQIRRAVAHIPIGAQTMLPNFNRIPFAGAKFAKKGDLWPIDLVETTHVESKPKKLTPTGVKKKDDMWL